MVPRFKGSKIAMEMLNIENEHVIQQAWKGKIWEKWDAIVCEWDVDVRKHMWKVVRWLRVSVAKQYRWLNSSSHPLSAGQRRYHGDSLQSDLASMYGKYSSYWQTRIIDWRFWVQKWLLRWATRSFRMIYALQMFIFGAQFSLLGQFANVLVKKHDVILIKNTVNGRGRSHMKWRADVNRSNYVGENCRTRAEQHCKWYPQNSNFWSCIILGAKLGGLGQCLWYERSRIKSEILNES